MDVRGTHIYLTPIRTLPTHKATRTDELLQHLRQPFSDRQTGSSADVTIGHCTPKFFILI